MVISYEKLSGIISKAFPEDVFDLEDTVGDENHYRLSIKSERFNGLSMVEQHKLVHKALEQYLGGDLHALSIKTSEL